MRILPDGYTQLEYIEGTGPQYIDTGFKPNQDTRAICDAQFLDISGEVSILGERTLTGTVQNCFAWISVGGNLRSYYHTQYGVIVPADTSRHLYELNKNVSLIDGKTLITRTYAKFTATYSIFIFNCSDEGTANFPTKLKLYSCQIYDDSTLVRNYIPCKNPSGEIGLYDLVNDVFYNNAGTGTFIAGPEFSYNKVEYIESSGTQHVNTGVIPKVGKTRVILNNFMLTDQVQGWEVFFGAETSDSSTDNFRFRRRDTSEILGANWGPAGGTYYSNYIYEYTPLSTLNTVEYGSNGLIVNGVLATASVTTSPVDGTYPIYLCAANQAGVAIRNSAMRFSSCQIYDNGTLVRDYIPVVGTDGIAGLWDKVEKVFYGNAGTGAFVAGAIIPEEPDVPPVEIPEMPTSIIAPYSDFANAVLIWSPVQGADTYNIQRDGILVDTTEMPFYYDNSLVAETVYNYAVTACNVAGESEPATIVAETTPFKLITDRTAEDVQAVLTAISTGVLPNNWLAGMKGAYNATDFNRVEAAVLFVLKRLEVAGWYLSVQTKTDWTFVDFPKQAEMQRYLDNIRLLRAALPTNIPAVPDTMRLLKYEDANRIEQILEMLDATVTNIMLNVYYANEIYSGEV